MAKRKRGNGHGTLFKRSVGGFWIASWYDHTGMRCGRSTRTTDRRAAERILVKHVADTALKHERVIDPQMAAIADESARSIESHLADFETKMKAGGRKIKTVRATAQVFAPLPNPQAGRPWPTSQPIR